jgi:hypothetical protein
MDPYGLNDCRYFQQIVCVDSMPFDTGFNDFGRYACYQCFGCHASIDEGVCRNNGAIADGYPFQNSCIHSYPYPISYGDGLGYRIRPSREGMIVTVSNGHIFGDGDLVAD